MMTVHVSHPQIPRQRCLKPWNPETWFLLQDLPPNTKTALSSTEIPTAKTSGPKQCRLDMFRHTSADVRSEVGHCKANQLLDGGDGEGRWNACGHFNRLGSKISESDQLEQAIPCSPPLKPPGILKLEKTFTSLERNCSDIRSERGCCEMLRCCSTLAVH